MRIVLGYAGLGILLHAIAMTPVFAQTDSDRDTVITKAEQELRQRIVGVWSLFSDSGNTDVPLDNIAKALRRCAGAEVFEQLSKPDRKSPLNAGDAALPGSVVYFLDNGKLTRVDIAYRNLTPIEEVGAVETDGEVPVWKLSANNKSIAVYFASLRFNAQEIPVMFENEQAYINCQTQLNQATPKTDEGGAEPPESQ